MIAIISFKLSIKLTPYGYRYGIMRKKTASRGGICGISKQTCSLVLSWMPITGSQHVWVQKIIYYSATDRSKITKWFKEKLRSVPFR